MLIIFPCGIIFIFLFYPQLFIDDIESLIEGQISSKTVGKLNIEYFGGNFIQGFNISNIQYQENGEIIFSASKMYIDPDLSRIFLGNAVLSEVIIWNSYYQHRNFSNYDEDIFSGNYNFPEFDLGFTCTPATSNPMGVKGCGEAGAIAAPPAVMNAVIDAIDTEISMPATAEKVWKACKANRKSNAKAAA